MQSSEGISLDANRIDWQIVREPRNILMVASASLAYADQRRWRKKMQIDSLRSAKGKTLHWADSWSIFGVGKEVANEEELESVELYENKLHA